MVAVVNKERQEAVEDIGFDLEDLNKWSYKYSTLKNNVPKRGVELKLSFRQYMRLAKKAGITKPDQIGRVKGKYQLGRYGDSGDYEIGNCRFILFEQNAKEWKVNGGLASSVKKQSNFFRLVDPQGKVHKGQNLHQFCKDNGLHRVYMMQMCTGRLPEYKGWTGRYTRRLNAKSASA